MFYFVLAPLDYVQYLIILSLSLISFLPSKPHPALPLCPHPPIHCHAQLHGQEPTKTGRDAITIAYPTERERDSVHALQSPVT